MIIPVILSGGSGTRLWPLSRKMHPKQLLPLVNDTTMLQDTITSLTGSPDIDHAMIICNDDYRFMVAEQVKETDISTNEIILEPVGRNTAPAIGLAALALKARLGPEAIMLVMPADHLVRDPDRFEEAVAAADRVHRSVDAILLDSGNPGAAVKELGGTGRTHDWRLSRRIREAVDVPVFLAGGLKPGNVAAAVDGAAGDVDGALASCCRTLRSSS